MHAAMIDRGNDDMPLVTTTRLRVHGGSSAAALRLPALLTLSNQEIQGSGISDKNVPGTRSFI
jgi:hypothetical protein